MILAVLIFLSRFTIILKKPISIFFLTVYLFSVTEASQLFKLPVLFQHFAEHKKENPNISVVNFIVLHYLSGNIKDKDYEKDMQLPFKTADCATAFSVATTPNYYQVIIEPPFAESYTYPALKNNYILPNHPNDIWQPPRVS